MLKQKPVEQSTAYAVLHIKEVLCVKTYRLNINGQEVNLCAKTLNISRKRCMAFLKNLMKKTKEEYGSYRFFWADVIVLNMLTNKILYHSDPKHIEKIIHPKGDDSHE